MLLSATLRSARVVHAAVQSKFCPLKLKLQQAHGAFGCSASLGA